MLLELDILEPVLFHIHKHKDALILSKQGNCRKIDATVFHTASHLYGLPFQLLMVRHFIYQG